MNHNTPRLAGAIALLAVAMPAVASLSDCAGIDDANKRLDCYDALAGRHPATGAGAAAAAAPAAVSQPAPDRSASLLTREWELNGNPELFHIRAYKPVYFLPVFHASKTNPTPYSPTRGYAETSGTPEKTEAKFQISFKTKVMDNLFGNNGDIWAGYTQSSRWQVYNGTFSRPFRETNYEPEAMFVWRTDFGALGMAGRYLSLGINHQSNGQSDPLSRSWNRVTGAIGLERGNWTLTVRPWWRIPEHGSSDDNPDLADYAGRGELLLTHAGKDTVFSVEARHSLRGGDRNHGSLRFDWAFSPYRRPEEHDLKIHVQWFTGYAESLIDYNHHANYLGLGISLKEWH